jgi:hypothetical protein
MVPMVVGTLLGMGSARAQDLTNVVGSGSQGVGVEPTSAASTINTSFASLQTIGLRSCRIAVDVNVLQDKGTSNYYMSRLDTMVNAAYARGMKRVVILVNYYTNPDWAYRFGTNPWNDWNWYWIGRNLADRFRPGSSWNQSQGHGSWGVEIYQAMNEPNNAFFNPPNGLDINYFVEKTKFFSQGVHDSNNALTVINGAFLGWSTAYGGALAPLFNNTTGNGNQRLDGWDVHIYNDYINYGPGVSDGSAQSGYNWWMTNTTPAITRMLPAYITECNFAVTQYNQISQDTAARNGFTQFWSILSLKDLNGSHQIKMMLAWDPLNPQRSTVNYNDEAWTHSMCQQVSPWQGNPRGRMLRLLSTVTKGMTLYAINNSVGDCYLTAGSGAYAKAMWVWHNRPSQGWTTIQNNTYTCNGIPAGTTRIEVYRYNAMNNSGVITAHTSKSATPGGSVTFTNLPANETLVFAAR